MKGSILVVDDDLKISQLACSVLKEAGYKTRHVDHSDAAVSLLKREPFDLLLLDIDLPGISGLKLLELLKDDPKTAGLPVIMMTVQGSENVKVKGLNTGADDYIVKPIAWKELLARVEALLRRVERSGQVGQVLEGSGISVDLAARQATTSKGKVDLTPTEFELLVALIRRKGQVLTYSILAEHLSSEKAITSGNLYVIVKSLRDKLGPQGHAIETVYGSGYRFCDS